MWTLFLFTVLSNALILTRAASGENNNVESCQDQTCSDTTDEMNLMQSNLRVQAKVEEQEQEEDQEEGSEADDDEDQKTINAYIAALPTPSAPSLSDSSSASVALTALENEQPFWNIPRSTLEYATGEKNHWARMCCAFPPFPWTGGKNKEISRLGCLRLASFPAPPVNERERYCNSFAKPGRRKGKTYRVCTMYANLDNLIMEKMMSTCDDRPFRVCGPGNAPHPCTVKECWGRAGPELEDMEPCDTTKQSQGTQDCFVSSTENGVKKVAVGQCIADYERKNAGDPFMVHTKI